MLHQESVVIAHVETSRALRSRDMEAGEVRGLGQDYSRGFSTARHLRIFQSGWAVGPVPV